MGSSLRQRRQRCGAPVSVDDRRPKRQPPAFARPSSCAGVSACRPEGGRTVHRWGRPVPRFWLVPPANGLGHSGKVRLQGQAMDPAIEAVPALPGTGLQVARSLHFPPGRPQVPRSGPLGSHRQACLPRSGSSGSDCAPDCSAEAPASGGLRMPGAAPQGRDCKRVPGEGLQAPMQACGCQTQAAGPSRSSAAAACRAPPPLRGHSRDRPSSSGPSQGS